MDFYYLKLSIRCMLAEYLVRYLDMHCLVRIVRYIYKKKQMFTKRELKS